jgi:hypothetical protein
LAKKKGQTEKLRAGLERLRKRGINVDEPSREPAAALGSHFGGEKEADLAIVYLLGRIHDPAALQALTEIEGKAADKEIQKEVRRAFFKLAQKGLTAPRPARAEAEAKRPALSLGPEIEAYLSSVDGSGGRLVWLAKPHFGGGLLMIQGMVSDREGLVRTGAPEVRRKELRRMAQEIKEKHGVTMISVPWTYADQILWEGYEKAKALGKSGIEGFPTLRAAFAAPRSAGGPHPVYGRLDPESARSGPWRELSRRLLDLPEFRFWILDEDWLKPYLESVRSAQESRLVLNELQKEERVAAIVRDAAREIFSGEPGRIFQRRMEDIALYLAETGKKEEALLALGVAMAIGEGDLGGLGALDVSFLTGLVQKSLAFYMSQAKTKAAEESSWIIKP